MLAATEHAEPLAKAGEAVKAGPVGLGVILLLIIACYFLFKSMSKHMRRVRENFPAEPVAPPRRATVDQPAQTATQQTAPPQTGQDPPTID